MKNIIFNTVTVTVIVTVSVTISVTVTVTVTVTVSETVTVVSRDGHAYFTGRSRLCNAKSITFTLVSRPVTSP